jgi:GntR family transcriptional regulator
VDITIDTASVEPVYEQIAGQVRQGVLKGELRPGSPIPTIRQLAHDLDLNPNTVAKAYKVLESERVILTAGKKGTFINRDAELEISNRNMQDAVRSMAALVASLHGKGLAAEHIHAAFLAAVATIEQA